MNNSSPSVAKSRLILLLITAIFALPFIGAAYYYEKARSGELWGTTNHGTLIQPLKPLQAFTIDSAEGGQFSLDDIRGKWTLLHVPAGNCDNACKETIFAMRKICALLGKEMSRVQRIMLVPAPIVDQELDAFLQNYPEMRVEVDIERRLIDQLPSLAMQPANTVLLIDPIGNVMMAFPPSVDAAKVLQDIRKLLKISQIG